MSKEGIMILNTTFPDRRTAEKVSRLMVDASKVANIGGYPDPQWIILV